MADKTWRDHTSPEERYTVLVEFEDGSAICLCSYTGGASPLGDFGGLTLMLLESDGTTKTRDYMATQSSWVPLEVEADHDG